MLPLDLHVLGLPLAFILSQDQTLRCIITSNLKSSRCRFFLKTLFPYFSINQRTSSSFYKIHPVSYKSLTPSPHLKSHSASQLLPKNRCFPHLRGAKIHTYSFLTITFWKFFYSFVEFVISTGSIYHILRFKFHFFVEKLKSSIFVSHGYLLL